MYFQIKGTSGSAGAFSFITKNWFFEEHNGHDTEPLMESGIPFKTKSKLIKCVFLKQYRGADKSLARPGRTQATATKLARCLTCFFSASVIRKGLQFVT